MRDLLGGFLQIIAFVEIIHAVIAGELLAHGHDFLSRLEARRTESI